MEITTKFENVFLGSNITRGYKNIGPVNYISAHDWLKLMGLDKLDLSTAYIAGGAVRDFLSGEVVNDIDIFTEDADLFLKQNVSEVMRVTHSPLGHMNLKIKDVNVKVQLIETDSAGGIVDLLMDFDIRMCRFLYAYDHIYYEAEAMQDLQDRKIVVASFHTVPMTLARMKKYVKRGYSPTVGTIEDCADAVGTYSDSMLKKQTELVKRGEDYEVFEKCTDH